MSLDPDHKELLERIGRRPQPDPVTRPYVHPKEDPLLDSNIDIPLDRIAREFRKRAGRAFGLGEDAQAQDARALCKAIEDFEKKYGRMP